MPIAENQNQQSESNQLILLMNTADTMDVQIQRSHQPIMGSTPLSAHVR